MTQIANRPLGSLGRKLIGLRASDTADVARAILVLVGSMLTVGAMVIGRAPWWLGVVATGLLVFSVFELAGFRYYRTAGPYVSSKCYTCRGQYPVEALHDGNGWYCAKGHPLNMFSIQRSTNPSSGSDQGRSGDETSDDEAPS